MRRLIAAGFAGLLCLVAATAAPAAAGCLSPDAVFTKLDPVSAKIAVNSGASAQAIADALAAHFKGERTEVSTVLAFISAKSDLVAVFGFDGQPCVAVSGIMRLAIYNDARIAAGLGPVPAPPPKPPGDSI